MQLNHINLTVTDVPAAAGFLTAYFGLYNKVGNAGMTLLSDVEDDSGMILSLMKGKAANVTYPDTFHIGFFIGSREEVDTLNARIRSDGYKVNSPEDTGHSYGFYVTAPGGFLVEVGA